jgi:4'-phosphopantetheinyl transferase
VTASAEPVPPLAAGGCQVWWGDAADAGPRHDALLAADDLTRRDRLTRPADRRRLTAAWAVARVLLGAAVGVPPARVRIDRTCPGCGAQHGKPRLLDDPAVQFSVSHSGDVVVVAVHRGGAVGVDVEEIGRFGPAELDLLAGQVLAPEERGCLRAVPAGERAAAFTTYWVRKEAVVKLTGEGLTAAPDTVVVSPPHEAPRLLVRRTADGGPAAVALHTLRPPAGFAAALAVAEPGGCTVTERDAGPLLRTTAASAR